MACDIQSNGLTPEKFQHKLSTYYNKAGILRGTRLVESKSADLPHRGTCMVAATCSSPDVQVQDQRGDGAQSEPQGDERAHRLAENEARQHNGIYENPIDEHLDQR